MKNRKIEGTFVAAAAAKVVASEEEDERAAAELRSPGTPAGVRAAFEAGKVLADERKVS